MAKKSINLKQFAYAIAVAEGVGFDVDMIILDLYNVFAKNAPASAALTGVMAEVYDVAKNLAQDPFGTGLTVGTNVAVVYASFKVLKFILTAIGAPCSKTIGGVTLRWA